VLCVSLWRINTIRYEKRHSPFFDSCLLWPNGWMDEDATWCGSRPRPRPHCIRRGPSSSRKGTAPLLFSAHVCCGHGRLSQLLLSSCDIFDSVLGDRLYKRSAIARMGDRARAKWAEKWGGAAVSLSVEGRAGSPSNTVSPGTRPTSVPTTK